MSQPTITSNTKAMGAKMPQMTPRARASRAAVAGLERNERTPRLISATSSPNAVMAATVAPIAFGHVRSSAECRDSSREVSGAQSDER